LIVREWKSTASHEKAADNLLHFRHSVLPQLRQIAGYKGAYILQRDPGDGVELTVQKRWETMDAIRKFAGENPEIAVVAPTARAILRTFDTSVTHYEIVLSADQASP
jgi:heme-degrading monooxygenase HmoA